MNNQEAYNQWAGSYDDVVNPTRDLEAKAIRAVLSRFDLSQSRVLELGAGTGKNTKWLLDSAAEITAADFSQEMLARARAAVKSDRIDFCETDLREKWPFEDASYDAITCSLILEHIEDLDQIFKEASRVLREQGIFYIGELHPGKQYLGSKARFDTGQKIFELNCFVHHVSDYLRMSKMHSFKPEIFEEWFDEGNRNAVPRLIVMVFQKC